MNNLLIILDDLLRKNNMSNLLTWQRVLFLYIIMALPSYLLPREAFIFYCAVGIGLMLGSAFFWLLNEFNPSVSNLRGWQRFLFIDLALLLPLYLIGQIVHPLFVIYYVLNGFIVFFSLIAWVVDGFEEDNERKWKQ